MSSVNKTCAVIGAGPAGLMAAEMAARAGCAVTVHDAMPSPGRKFLMAGRGGLNLTHSEDLPPFLRRYREAEPHLRAAIEAFPPRRLRDFSEQLGQPTFVGSSGRVFPQAMKASPLLRAWLRRLDALGVRIATRHRWTGWDEGGALRFATPDGEKFVVADATLLALGGASWPKLGSDGTWVPLLRGQGIEVRDLKAANCGFAVAWSAHFRDRFEGAPLKRVGLSFGGETARGEIMVTREGIEGGAVYALSPLLRAAIEQGGETTLHVDLLPDLPMEEIATRLARSRGKQSLSNHLRKVLSLAPGAIGLAQEATQGRLAAMDAQAIAGLLKAIPVRFTGIAPLTRAISSAGGVPFSEIDAHFMLRKKPGLFVAGEMLDWEAPTGGYLLQACFATGYAAGEGMASYLIRHGRA